MCGVPSWAGQPGRPSGGGCVGPPPPPTFAAAQPGKPGNPVVRFTIKHPLRRPTAVNTHPPRVFHCSSTRCRAPEWRRRSVLAAELQSGGGVQYSLPSSRVAAAFSTRCRAPEWRRRSG
eukprot:gene8774-biopygen16661